MLPMGRYFSLQCGDSGACNLIDIHKTYNHTLKGKGMEIIVVFKSHIIKSESNQVSDYVISYNLVCISLYCITEGGERGEEDFKIKYQYVPLKTYQTMHSCQY